MPNTLPDVGIVGAGIVGLACALLLTDAGYNVTVVARELPGDMTTDWASPWAGALLAPHPDGDAEMQKESIRHYQTIARKDISAGIKDTVITEYYDDRSSDAPIWYQKLFPDFHFLPPSDLPEKAEIGFKYTGMTVNPTDFLPWLMVELQKRGAKFIRAALSSMDELRSLTEARVLINASGLGAKQLANDDGVLSVRGQTMFVKCNFKETYILQGSEYTYVIPRISAGGVILGGVSQPSSTDTAVDHNLKQDILQRVNRVTRNAFGWVDVDRDVHNIVGFRPGRRGGVRVEKEGDIVHAYGGGSLGYVYAFGMASRVKSLVVGLGRARL